MTAQVAVMNTLGIALATDSAVSIGPDANKIYVSADKLFQLAEKAPIAIMINGNADFLGVPWETVVKVYRAQLGQRFDSLSEYADDFLGFVQANTSMFPDTLRDEYVGRLIENLLEDVLDEIEDQLEEENNQSRRASSENASSIIHKVVKERTNEEREHRRVKGFGPAAVRDFRTRYGKQITTAKKDIFEEYPLLPKTSRSLDTMISEAITRTNFGSMKAEIVFAGFGEGEYMPSLLAYEVEGMVHKKLRYRLNKKTHISPECTAAIMPFAQRDVMDAFLDGINPEFKSYMEEGVKDFLIGVTEIYDDIPNLKLTDRAEKKLASAMLKKLEDLFEAWNEAEENSWLPIVRIMEYFPKDELVATSEMLVNLTKFRLRISSDQEIVGGPIDVAVITKGDGFVWVKRKHYFPTLLSR